jgi:hypothetical protein
MAVARRNPIAFSHCSRPGRRLAAAPRPDHQPGKPRLSARRPARDRESGKDRTMKTTLMMAALALMLTAPAYAQNQDEERPRRPERERLHRGPGGPQFRGGEPDADEPGRYGPPPQCRRGWQDEEAPGPGCCPNCGAPLRLRQGPGAGPRWPGDDQDQAPGPRMGRPGYGPGPRLDGPSQPPGPPPRAWGREEGWERGPQGAPGFGPRGRGYGRPDWEDDEERPVRRGAPEQEESER